MTARPIRRNAQTPDRNGKIFYTSTTSLSHISKEARQEANKEVMSMVGSMLAAMQANKGEISIIQQQADTDDNADLDADFYDGVIAQSALNWMEKD